MEKPGEQNPAGSKPQPARIGLLPVVGQCFSIGPLIDVALFLGIVAATAGAVGPLAVLLAALGMVAFYASGTGGAAAVGDYIARAWGPVAGTGVLGIYVVSLLFSGAAGFMVAVGGLAERFASLYFGVELPWRLGGGNGQPETQHSDRRKNRSHNGGFAA